MSDDVAFLDDLEGFGIEVRRALPLTFWCAALHSAASPDRSGDAAEWLSAEERAYISEAREPPTREAVRAMSVRVLLRQKVMWGLLITHGCQVYSDIYKVDFRSTRLYSLRNECSARSAPALPSKVGFPMDGAIVVIVGSEGSLKPLRRIVAGLPEGLGAAVFVVTHTGAHRSRLPALLNGRLPANFAVDGEMIKFGRVYAAPPDRHMLLEPGRIRLNNGPKVHHARPAGDPLFLSAAHAYGERLAGVVLGGGDGDGAEGLNTIKQLGGLALVQDPEVADKPSMPVAAIMAGHPDGVLRIPELTERLQKFCAIKAKEPVDERQYSCMLIRRS